MTNSILNSTKKILGIDSDYDAFDLDILTHINSAFFTLNSIGIGPENGFMIDDSTTEWVAYIGEDIRLNAVKSYVFLKVRLVFDPPTSSAAQASMEKMVSEYEWRLNCYREETSWKPPVASDDVKELYEFEIDGGDSSD